MPYVKTNLVFAYEPADFFEEPTTLTLSVGSVTFDGGRAVLTLTAPTDKVESAEANRATEAVRSAMQAQSVIAHRSFVLKEPHVENYHADGRRDCVLMDGSKVEFVITNPRGQ